MKIETGKIETVGKCIAYVDGKTFLDTDDVTYWNAAAGYMFLADVNNEYGVTFSVPHDRVADGADHVVHHRGDEKYVWKVWIEGVHLYPKSGFVKVTFGDGRKKAKVELDFTLVDGRHVTGNLEVENQ